MAVRDQASFLSMSLARGFRPSRDEILAFQSRRLRALVRHAYRRVPFYKRLLDAHGMRPEEIRGREDLQHLPIVERRQVQAAPLEDVLARGTDPRRVIPRSTSGSTGEPITIRRTRGENRVLHLLRLRAQRDLGRRARDLGVSIAYPHRPTPGDRKLLLRSLDRLGFFREVRLDCLRPPGQLAAEISSLQPDVVHGFPGLLFQVAPLFAESRRSSRVRLVLTGGEVLTRAMRWQIAEGFGAPVAEAYASHEFNLLAWECSRTGGYHVCDDGVILEVLRDGRPAAPGERGEVVATALHSFAMPFLRYRLGDLVTAGEERCPCGAPFSTLRAIQGRMIDYFTLPGGRLVHPYQIVESFFWEIGPWLRQYRITQERLDRIVLTVAPRAEIPSYRLRAVERSIAGVVGPGVALEIVLVPEIEIEPSGKFRVSRSKVASPYDEIDWARV